MFLHRTQTPLETGATNNRATRALILLHGRGASPESMLPLANAVENPFTRILLPRAAANTWYPYSFLAPTEQNEPALSEALHTVAGFLDLLSDQFGSENVAIAGFSQGACLALESACRFNRRLLAVAGFSGGLIGPPGTSWQMDKGLTGTPVFLGCHTSDPHIPLERVHETSRVFFAKGAIPEVQIYPGPGHHLMPGAAEWLRDRLLPPVEKDGPA